jgi:hypothetical protein
VRYRIAARDLDQSVLVGTEIATREELTKKIVRDVLCRAKAFRGGLCADDEEQIPNFEPE